MTEFRYFLNRQGVRGAKGDKGEKGFSPVITEKENTKESYVLHIQNETDDTSFDTPNLKEGLVPEDLGGTYVKLNRDTGKQYYGNIDEGTNTIKGIVRFATDVEASNGEEVSAAVTPDQVAASYTTKATTNKLSADLTALTTQEQNDVIALGKRITTNETNISSMRADINSIASDSASLKNSNRFTGTNTFTGKVNIAGAPLEVDGVATLNQVTAQYLNAVNITSSGEINAVSIKANGLRSDDIQTTENKKYLTELDVDNQTIQVVNGKLHANLDELGNEVNDLSGRVTVNEADISAIKTGKQNKLTAGANVILTDLTDGTVRIDAAGGGGTGDIPIATTTTAGKVKPDGETITITDDGTISAVGSGGGATIDDTTTATTSVWSSSKTNTEITTAVDTINSTKNDNIFDISKFTVVGNPTITDDGVASGFSSSNYITVYQNERNQYSKLRIDLSFTVDKTSNGVQSVMFLVGTASANIGFFINQRANRFLVRILGVDRVSVPINLKENVNISIEYDNSNWIVKNKNTGKTYSFVYNINDLFFRGMYLGNRPSSNDLIFYGSIDLKHFSITANGEEVSKGLMSSTKPIYDAIKANNTELSAFKTETSNDFSAVNSALNEKANLSDLGLKQNILISGTNIKTINGQSILGEGNITVGDGGGGSTPTNMVTTDTAQDITANKTFYGEIRVGADNNYATLAKFSKEALVSGDSTLSEHIDLGEADFVVQGNLGKKVYETDKYVYKKYINVDDLSDNAIKMDNSISSQVAHMAMPSNKYIDLTLGASGATYTAPADGWVLFKGTQTGNAGWVELVSTKLSVWMQHASDNFIVGNYLPIRKNEIFTVKYENVNPTHFRFVYAVGSEPAA